MPKPQTVRNVALGALLLGMIFLGANLYFGAHRYYALANTSFMLAIVFIFIFALAAVLWSYCAAWVREPQRQGGPMPGAMPGMMPGVQMKGMPMPGAAGLVAPGHGGPRPGAPTSIIIDAKPAPPPPPARIRAAARGEGGGTQ
jgi:hypothetical protein